MRPAVPPPQFHSSSHVKLTTAAKHKIKLGSKQIPAAGMEDAQSLLAAPKGGGGNSPNVRIHKRKHKHKHVEEQLSRSDREDLGGLFSGAKNACFLGLLSKRLGMSDKEPALPKLRDKQRNQQSADTLLRSSRNIFEVDTLSTLPLSEPQQWKCTRKRGELVRDFHTACTHRHSDSVRTGKDLSPDLLGRFRSPQQAQAAVGNVRQNLKSFGVYRERNMVPFINGRVEKVQQTFHCPNASLGECSHPLKKRFKRKEMEELQCEVRKMCAFSTILSTKKNLDHVNKILKAKRLQRQAKTGNNVVKRRRGRPRKQLSPPDEEGGRGGGGARGPDARAGEDSIADAIESVVHMARERPDPSARGSQRWSEALAEVRPDRAPRRCRRGNAREEVAVPMSRQSGAGFFPASYSLVRSSL
ncbi:hypothetical protein AAFF_G00016450 [Aldrovandia affinis]|uniref:Uncharacterized protein n=1 Tax=Aldrovandia affinis TaxID=143900 RepID=A0AAD7S611_9TELE|nr:hypothetical protein AAFF_G00016450 [Aldrovandia affinis]